MSWFRVDDNLHAHRKARRAGAEAMGLWVACGSYASSPAGGGTGELDSDDVAYVASGLGIRAWKKVAARLVEVGLWEATATGIRFHDWADYRPAGDAELERRRSKDAERKRKARLEASADASADIPQTPPRTSADARPHLPVPSRPVPEREEPPPSDVTSRRPPPDPELGDVFTAALASAGYRVAISAFAWKELSTAAAVHWPDLTPDARREALGAAAKTWASEADAFTRERGFTPKLFVSWLNARGATSSPASGPANDDARAAQIARNREFKLARARAEADAAEASNA